MEETFYYPDYDDVDYSSDNKGWGARFVILLSWILIIGLIIWLIIIAIQSTLRPVQIIFPQQPQAINSNTSTIGASTDGVINVNNGINYSSSTTCNTGPTRNWGPINSNTSGCRCLPPFYGSNCFQESYNSNYVAVGEPNMNDITLPPTTEYVVDRLSFPWTSNQIPPPVQTICTEACQLDDTCTGVLWQAPSQPDMGTSSPSGVCTLLHGNLVVNDNATISYRPLEQSTLFLKQNYHAGAPWFSNQVFMYNGQLPLRYWLNSTYSSVTGRMIRLTEGQITTLSFRPRNIINDPLLYGIFNQNTFSQTQAQETLQRYLLGQDVQPYIVLPPNEQPNFPDTWTLFYGMFISN